METVSKIQMMYASLLVLISGVVNFQPNLNAMLGKRIRSLQKALVKEHDVRYIAPYVGHVETFDKLYGTNYCFINQLEEHFFSEREKY